MAAALSACKKSFIEKVPQSALTTGNFFKTASDAETALTGAYITMRNGFYQYNNLLFTDGRSDNCYVNGDDNTGEWPLENFTYTPANTKVGGEWADLYNMIASANTVLDNVPNITDPALSATRKNQILAEARFLRAMHYYWLVTEWGPTPLVLTTNYNGNYTPKRASVADVYAQIIADLQFADTNLPLTPANGQAGRATQGAADALLAKTYAQMGDYANCLTYCNKVINGGQYSLVPNFANLWGVANKNNVESIFEIQSTQTGTYYNYGAELWDYVPADNYPKRNIGSADLIKAFAAESDTATSARYHTTFYWHVANAAFNMPLNAWDPAKPIPFVNKQPDPGGFDSPDDIELIRYADIILLAAEANNQLGNAAAATTELNQIRTRAGVANTTATTKTDLALAILNERRLELVNEGCRWHDLLRANANGTINIITLMNNQHDSHGTLLQYGVNGA
ncbi:MAG TPA: RagB/SusD family nutrient uptake outer membrane protein, partial [Mucilaginibacter sp.]|nr:RagB/SusD family nutrient uptake outer membrane protein [Mucilaginibacter sp.]